MRCLLILHLSLLLFSNPLGSQCPVGDVHLITQSDVNQFAMDFPSCTQVTGRLILGELNANSDITDLSPLSNIVTVTGDLIVVDIDGITSLNGLQFQSLGGISINQCDLLSDLSAFSLITQTNLLSFFNNQALSSLASFANLQSIGSQGLRISQCPSLTTLGLTSLVVNQGQLFLSDLPVLTSLTGLGSFTSIGDRLEISNCDQLVSLSGIPAFTSMVGPISIRENDLLTSLNGLGALTGVTSVTLENNAALQHLGGLQVSGAMSSGLRIINNAQLNSITGLHGITSVSGGFIFQNNDALTVIDLPNLTAINASFGFTGFLQNDALTQLGPFNNLTTVQRLDIINNSNLVNLNAFPNLANCTGNIGITGNSSLENLVIGVGAIQGSLTISTNPIESLSFPNLQSVGFRLEVKNSNVENILMPNLTNVGENLVLNNNDLLSSLTGLSSLAMVGNALQIFGNNLLADCSGLCHLLDQGFSGPTFFSGNLTGCNALAEVNQSCSPVCVFSTDTMFLDTIIPCNFPMVGPKVRDACVDSFLCGTPLDSSFYFTQGDYQIAWEFSALDGTKDTVMQMISVAGVIVCDTVATGIGSLANAIGCANPEDTIDFLSLLSDDTLSLSGGALHFDQNVYLIADSMDHIVIDGAAVAEVMSIDMGVKVFIQGLTIISGSANIGSTALNNGSLCLEQCTLLPHPFVLPTGSRFGGNGELTLLPGTEIK